ncbi:small ribosomal subunit protein bS18-like isoform X1 [Montipora foliosa]|uniref:small ribosomal subunit protein bS18-like isoform X1 n=1 Tax=Montipora foliosa TaxID=591990 RepID=UPI0035F16ABB
MAASGLFPRLKCLKIVSVNHVNSLLSLRNFSLSCIRTSSCAVFSKICGTYDSPLTVKPTSFLNGVKHFNTQNTLGVKASVLTEDKINKADIGCPICSRDITFTYKDVLFLSQFMSPRGYIINRRVTGVCRKQQRKLEKAIKISQRLGLLPKLAPAVQRELEEKRLVEKKSAAQNRT